MKAILLANLAALSVNGVANAQSLSYVATPSIVASSIKRATWTDYLSCVRRVPHHNGMKI
jgi:hypothetical protein